MLRSTQTDNLYSSLLKIWGNPLHCISGWDCYCIGLKQSVLIVQGVLVSIHDFLFWGFDLGQIWALFQGNYSEFDSMLYIGTLPTVPWASSLRTANTKSWSWARLREARLYSVPGKTSRLQSFHDQSTINDNTFRQLYFETWSHAHYCCILWNLPPPVFIIVPCSQNHPVE